MQRIHGQGQCNEQRQFLGTWNKLFEQNLVRHCIMSIFVNSPLDKILLTTVVPVFQRGTHSLLIRAEPRREEPVEAQPSPQHNLTRFRGRRRFVPFVPMA